MKIRTIVLASMLSLGALFAGRYNVDVDHSYLAF